MSNQSSNQLHTRLVWYICEGVNHRKEEKKRLLPCKIQAAGQRKSETKEEGKKKMNSRRKGVTESENKKSNEVITKLFGALWPSYIQIICTLHLNIIKSKRSRNVRIVPTLIKHSCHIVLITRVSYNWLEKTIICLFF